MASNTETTPLLSCGQHEQAHQLDVSQDGLSEIVIISDNSCSSEGSGSIAHMAGELNKHCAETDNDQTASNSIYTGDFKALVTILKGNLGTGILAMPFAVSCAGIWMGSICILLIGFLALICMHLLVRSCCFHRRRTAAEEGSNVKMTYERLMVLSLLSCNPRLENYPKFMKLVSLFVNGLLILSQLGFCSIYMVFVATNIKETADAGKVHSPALWVYLSGVASLLLVYCLVVRKLDTLSFFSAIGNILTIICLSMIFVNFTSHPFPDVSTRPSFVGWSRMPIFFSTVVFSFEGISLVLPVEAQVKNKQRFSSWCGVLTLSIVIVTCLYATVGFFGFLRFGEASEASITLNLPSHPWFYGLVKPGFAVVIFLSFNVQFYVPVDITWPWLRRKLNLECEERRCASQGAESVWRIFLVSLTFTVAMVCPRLDVMIAFVGAFAGSFLTIILPATMFLLIAYSQPQAPRPAQVIGLILLIVFGFLVFGLGTHVAIEDMISGGG